MRADVHPVSDEEEPEAHAEREAGDDHRDRGRVGRALVEEIVAGRADRDEAGDEEPEAERACERIVDVVELEGRGLSEANRAAPCRLSVKASSLRPSPGIPAASAPGFFGEER